MAKFRRKRIDQGFHVGFYGGQRVQISGREIRDTEDKGLMKSLRADEEIEEVFEDPEEPKEGNPDGDGKE